MELSQVRLLVDDFGAAFRWYRDVLGLEPGFGDETSGYASFSDSPIAIFRRDEQAEVVALRAAGDGTLLALQVADLDAEADRLREHVVAGPTDRRDWGIRVLYVRDSSGNLLELHQEVS